MDERSLEYNGRERSANGHWMEREQWQREECKWTLDGEGTMAERGVQMDIGWRGNSGVWESEGIMSVTL
jgi:hypothetical protein